MSYLVNEVFYTLQGEGYWTGRPAVFVRFSRCNLWTGREEDRASAICKFCDTDFTAGTRYTRDELVDAILSAWPGGAAPMVVFTGGEPLLQLDEGLLSRLRAYYKAVETNGTRPVPEGLDWVCVSPKANARLVVTGGDELKLVYPQEGAPPPDFYRMHYSFSHYWISPMDGPNLKENTARAVKYVLGSPRGHGGTAGPWRLNVQTHKIVGLP